LVAHPDILTIDQGRRAAQVIPMGNSSDSDRDFDNFLTIRLGFWKAQLSSSIRQVLEAKVELI